MIEIILDVISTIQVLIHYTLFISYNAGKMIITVLQFIGNHCAGFVLGTASVLKVIIEDFGVFIVDAAERLWFLVNLILTFVEYIFSFLFAINGVIKNIGLSINHFASTTYLSVITFLHKITSAGYQVLVWIKYLFVLLGSGVWFALTIIPVTIFYTGVMFTYYIGRFFEECSNVVKHIGTEFVNFLLNVKQFFTDVPVEATLGLIFTACIIYVISKCYLILFIYLKEKVKIINEVIRYYGLWIKESYLKKFLKPEVVVVHRTITDDSNHCVVCQERQKCVLILPCRHLCICFECNENIYHFRYKCPICRTKVDKTMKVFV